MSGYARNASRESALGGGLKNPDVELRLDELIPTALLRPADELFRRFTKCVVPGELPSPVFVGYQQRATRPTQLAPCQSRGKHECRPRGSNGTKQVLGKRSAPLNGRDQRVPGRPCSGDLCLGRVQHLRVYLEIRDQSLDMQFFSFGLGATLVPTISGESCQDADQDDRELTEPPQRPNSPRRTRTCTTMGPNRATGLRPESNAITTAQTKNTT